MKKILTTTGLCAMLLMLINGCKKTPELPPVKSLNSHNTLTIDSLKKIAKCDTCPKVFLLDTYVSGVSLTDQSSGNLYKEAFMRDGSGALHLTFKASVPNIFIGDSVRLNLKGLSIGYNATTLMLEVDSIDADLSYVRVGRGVMPAPKEMDMAMINSPGYFDSFMNQLVIIHNIGFAPSDTGQLYVALNASAQSRNLLACAGTQLVLRTSSYAKFANDKIPGGVGYIVGIATNYSTTKQLVIRNTSEWAMNSTGCPPPKPPIITKDFNDNSIGSGGWLQLSINNSGVLWSTSVFSTPANTTPFAKISGFLSGGNQPSENWLVSPVIDLSATNSPILTFQTAAKFSGNPLEVMVSTNYSGGLPNTATWTSLAPGYALSPTSGSYVWTPSGSVSLSAFKSAHTTIAFKYSSTSAGATTYELDDITVRDNN